MNDLIVVEKHAEWQRLKALVLDSVSSPITRRVYNMALDEFIEWYRAASATVRNLRCVFEDSDICNTLVRELLLKHIDQQILGDHYRADSIVTDPETNHFDLSEPDRVARHLDLMIDSLREQRNPVPTA